MSFEAITSITEAEAEARYTVSSAQTRAKQMLEDAQSAGELAVEAACAKAENELAELNRQAGEKAKTGAAGLAGELETKKAAMRARAERNMDKAAGLVVERIVNG